MIAWAPQKVANDLRNEDLPNTLSGLPVSAKNLLTQPNGKTFLLCLLIMTKNN